MLSNNERTHCMPCWDLVTKNTKVTRMQVCREIYTLRGWADEPDMF
jgi:hypothetical protein